MAVNGQKLILLLICSYSAQCNVCKMKSMQRAPVCARSQDKEYHVSMDSNQTWDQGDQVVSDPALVAEVKNISPANVSVSGDGWIGSSNDSVVGDVSNETTTVYQDGVGLDFREGSGSEQQDPANSTDWPSDSDRGNMTTMDNVTTRDRVFGCPQLTWKGVGVTLAISVCVLGAFCSVICSVWDCAEWYRGDIGKPGDENQLCYHCRRMWWVCTVPRAQQRKWRVTQNRKWRERNVSSVPRSPTDGLAVPRSPTDGLQVVPAPAQESGYDNGFQEIELGEMG